LIKGKEKIQIFFQRRQREQEHYSGTLAFHVKEYGTLTKKKLEYLM
jgi:hypothetical protein